MLVCQRARAVRRGERCRAGRRRAERAMVSDKVSVEGAVDICRQEKWSRLARERAKGRHASIVVVLRMCYGITDRHRGSVGGAGHRGVVLAAARALCVSTWGAMMWQ